MVKLSMKKNRHLKRGLFFLLFLTIVIAIFSYFTNPFVKFSLVEDPVGQVAVVNNQITIDVSKHIKLRENLFFGVLAKVKSGWHIVGSRFAGGKKASGYTVDQIIAEIHSVRFDPNLPFLISGDHFSVLYPRSLGIFYHTLLDDRTALSPTDWQNRQIIYLKTLAYACGIFSQSDRLSTTIVPVAPSSVALMNIYAPPSDTLYSLLFAFEQLLDNSYQEKNYPFVSEKRYELATTQAAAQLLDQHRADLKRHYEKYKQDAFDTETGLIKKNILLSGTKDIMKRSGAFYDNVIFWKTTKLAGELGIITPDETFLAKLKNKILGTYWDEAEGFFLEDLSPDSIAKKHYSSDWLIAFQTGFLDVEDEAERQYYLKAVAYIERNAIDKPFALQYHPDLRRERLYGLVKWFSPAYGSTAIWSNWGMEYTKLLTRLADVEKDLSLLEQAKTHLDAYTFNIKRYQGYPEVYDQSGDFYKTIFYKSIRRTGWVVTYEQARAMYQDVARSFLKP